MPALRTYIIILLMGFLSACSLTATQPELEQPKQEEHKTPETTPIIIEPVKPVAYEEVVSPGVFIVEVRSESNNQQGINGNDLLLMQQLWQKRTNELCQYGYRGDSAIITATQARIEALHCDAIDCASDILVSGIVWCHQRYSL